MLFTSIEFLVFFVIVFAAYWAVASPKIRGLLVIVLGGCFCLHYQEKLATLGPDSSFIDFYTARLAELLFIAAIASAWVLPLKKVRILMLLFSSYYFYMSFNPKLAAVVAGSSLVDYFLARLLQRSEDQRRRRLLMGASVVMNLGLLVYFKYMNFFLQSFGDLLNSMGFSAHMPLLEVVLPIGISFYTFEAVSYMVDVYNRRAEAEKNPLHFLLFITFFPRMVAGPIIRAKNFLPQLGREKRFDWGRFQLGVQLVLMGLYKKLAIADRMAALVDPVYKSPELYSTSGVWNAVMAYSLQIYGDFSGYSDIALGTAHMLGFKLPENFNMPYMAKNIAEFWRRWHISLSTWLRDYVFIPMGGSRGTASATMMTLMITFTLCGLWHGAKWTFVAWGVVQGLMMITHRSFAQFSKARPGLKNALDTVAGKVLRVFVTFMAVTVSWVIFRAENFTQAGQILRAMFTSQKGMTVRTPLGPGSILFAFVVVLVCHVAVETGLWKKIAARLTPAAWGFIYAVVLVLAFLLTIGGQKAFIYFQF